MTLRLDRRFPILTASSLPELVRTLGEFTRTLYQNLQAVVDAVNALDTTTGQLAGSSVVYVATTSTTLSATGAIVLVDDTAAGGAVTVNLPTLSGNEGLQYTVKKLGNTAAVTLDAHGAQTIDGSTTYALALQYESVTLVAGTTTTGWCVL